LAEERGVRVTGSELVGLIPLEAIKLAGEHYLRKQQRTIGVTEELIIETAIQSLGLNDVTPFVPDEKIIDFAVKSEKKGLVDLSIKGFIDETSSNSPAPGGGSVSALAGSLASALTAMVAALSYEKKGFIAKREMMEKTGVKAQKIKDRLTFLIDEDTNAFNNVMAANRLPSTSEEEINLKTTAILEANKYATEIPSEVAQLSLKIFDLAQLMVEEGNPNSVSDAGVAGEAAYAAVRGACLNVLINLDGIESDEKYIKNKTGEVERILDDAEKFHQRIFEKTREVINK
jgi:glutamate formiminotransferase/formiminotetrahydrofolate cyclodeaminase